ncbi:adenylate/guanylate cyclase domain-containing protein [Vulcanococcus limneticus]|uniref:adenylate/guanylate cyclase domain-containing protein n=1 Tax=Vulcanococcus limneticus TaxID=2170428 RepID=UPI001E61AE3B|nr:adenylate/guanylate cyclase domain-containing protein [Vulcanococcus limneticus]
MVQLLVWMQRLSRGSVNRLSIKSKLILMLLLVSGFSTLFSAALGYRSGQINLTNRVFNQLTSVRASKAYQIESYFRNIQNHTQTLSEDLSIVAAVQQFDAAYQQLNTVPEPAAAGPAVETYYRRQFLPRLDRIHAGTPNLAAYLPVERATRHLQYNYIAANPNPVGKKQQLVAANDGSTYSQVHGRYHPIFRNIVARFGYYDMFLLNPKGQIVYTVFKETDYATNLFTGPYRDTNLAQLVRQVISAREKGFTQLVDFAAYAPSYGTPASFIAAPIYDGSRLVGVLAFQMPVDEINNVMTGNQDWQQDGLGQSGETILVGHDRLMRSASRFYLQNPRAYLAQLQSRGFKEESINRLRQYGTTILQQPVSTPAVTSAIAGGSGTRQVVDYRGVPVLSSYAPLQIQGFDWVILAQMDLAEAYAPIHAFQRQILITVTLLILLVTVLAMALAHLFVRPVQQLIDSARRVSSGELTSIPALNSGDEFGELGQSFNAVVHSLQTQTALVDQKNRENEKLLFSVFPAAIARRLQRGETQIAEDVTNVAVLFADLKGFSRLVSSLSAHESLAVLNDLVASFDDLAARFGLEKVKTIGDSYLAVCGLSVPYLDHDKRALDFAIEMLGILRRFNLERGFQLGIQIGIHSGDIVAGIVGKSRVVYDVWGETVKQAHALSQACPSGGVLVSEVVHHRLEDLYPFERTTTGGEPQPAREAWRLSGAAVASAGESLANP